jgi:hypothetical protein
MQANCKQWLLLRHYRHEAGSDCVFVCVACSQPCGLGVDVYVCVLHLLGAPVPTPAPTQQAKKETDILSFDTQPTAPKAGVCVCVCVRACCGLCHY